MVDDGLDISDTYGRRDGQGETRAAGGHVADNARPGDRAARPARLGERHRRAAPGLGIRPLRPDDGDRRLPAPGARRARWPGAVQCLRARRGEPSRSGSRTGSTPARRCSRRRRTRPGTSAAPSGRGPSFGDAGAPLCRRLRPELMAADPGRRARHRSAGRLCQRRRPRGRPALQPDRAQIRRRRAVRGPAGHRGTAGPLPGQPDGRTGRDPGHRLLAASGRRHDRRSRPGHGGRRRPSAGSSPPMSSSTSRT